MNRSLITENRNLRAKCHRLEKENLALREQCRDACHETLIEQMRVKYQIPRDILTKTSYELLEKMSFPEVERYFADRAIMMARVLGNKPKIVSEEVFDK